MKQLSSRILATVLSCALIASALVGALSASVLPAEAAYGVEKYTGDFYETILSYGVVDSGLESWFDWLAGVSDYSNGNRDKFVCAFESDTFIQISVYISPSTFELYSRQYVNSNDNYNGIGWNQSDWYETACTFAVLGNLRFNKTNNYLSYGHNDGYSQNQTVTCMLRNETYSFVDTYWFNKSSTNMAYPCRDVILDQNILVFCNRQIYSGADSSFGFSYSPNLVPGNAPVIVQEYHWFKFNLGDRWYITTYDQSLMSMLEPGDSTFWVWSMYASTLSDPENAVPIFIWWPDVQYLSYAENFISENLINVSSSGVLAYDITDLILDPDYIFLGIADFYQVLDTTSGYVLGDLMAESTDQIELTLSPSEENQSNDQAWTVINNYFTNFPSVTVAPKELASQFAGQTAYTGGIGTVQIPQQLQEYKTGGTLPDLDSEFHYDLSSSGLQPSEMSYLNFDLLNVVIVPARNSDVVDAAAFNLRYWDYSVPVVNGCIDSYQIGHFHYSNDLFESFDLILIVDADSWWLQDTSTPYTVGPYSHLMYGYTGDISPDEGLVQEFGLFPCYWVLTRSAIQKSQLYVFCDGFDKLYDLASQFALKRDLWDNSFFDWSMSIFWELQSLDGHLNAIEFEITSWHLSDRLDSIKTAIDRVVEKTDSIDEENVTPWYLSLWNFVTQFKPSNNQIGTGIDYLNDNLDNIPLLPVMTPVPALPTPGGG